MRLIDADALMELLTTAIRNMKGMAKFLGAEDDPEIQMEIKAYTDIANGVNDMPTIPTIEPQQWISCSERMPDAKYGEGDSVLCCTELCVMHILYWNGGNWCVPTGEPHQWVNHKTGWHDKVIAWMPLPEPARLENDNETD